MKTTSKTETAEPFEVTCSVRIVVSTLHFHCKNTSSILVPSTL